jgi:hypothetical protein
VRAIGPGARHEVHMAIEQQGRALVLDHGRKRLDMRQQRAWIGWLEPQQHGRDIGRFQEVRKHAEQSLRVVDGRRRKVEARGWTRLDRL